jgi:hypothetical protein
MISVHEIHKIERIRKTIRKETYTKIYDQFSKKIRYHVEIGLKSVVLSVPSFVMGCPTFDRKKAADYLCRQFVNGGFIVDRLSQTDLYVDWNIKAHTKKKKKAELSMVDESDTYLPTLINLKKLATKHRGA